jgi:hypothetical protein
MKTFPKIDTRRMVRGWNRMNSQPVHDVASASALGLQACTVSHTYPLNMAHLIVNVRAAIACALFRLRVTQSGVMSAAYQK